jgi:hypothetical protein
MAVDFEPGWLTQTADYLTTEALARRLVRTAAHGLAQDTRIEVIVWCNAATGGAHLLRVTKPLHQPEGPLGDLLHITMKLYIPGCGQGTLVPNTHFKGKFHLYAKVLNPTSHSQRIQPTQLTYQTVGHDFNRNGEGFLKADISNPGSISGNLTSES